LAASPPSPPEAAETLAGIIDIIKAPKPNDGIPGTSSSSILAVLLLPLGAVASVVLRTGTSGEAANVDDDEAAEEAKADRKKEEMESCPVAPVAANGANARNAGANSAAMASTSVTPAMLTPPKTLWVVTVHKSCDFFNRQILSPGTTTTFWPSMMVVLWFRPLVSGLPFLRKLIILTQTKQGLWNHTGKYRTIGPNSQRTVAPTPGNKTKHMIVGWFAESAEFELAFGPLNIQIEVPKFIDRFFEAHFLDPLQLQGLGVDGWPIKTSVAAVVLDAELHEGILPGDVEIHITLQLAQIWTNFFHAPGGGPSTWELPDTACIQKGFGTEK
jgi:hypothetical protein